MSGRAIGMNSCMFAGLRVAGTLTYILPHTKNGEKQNGRTIIPVYQNSHRGTNYKTGEKGRRDAFKFVAWGKLANVCCKSLPTGKALDIISHAQSYEGRLFNIDGSARVDHTGQPMTTNKVSFEIERLIFGEESSKQIYEEIQTGRRPAQWDNPKHTDFDLWTDMLLKKQALTWDGRSQMFGYARVVIPQGPGIQVDFTAPTNPAPMTYPDRTTYTAPIVNRPAPVQAPGGNYITDTNGVQYVQDASGAYVPVTPAPVEQHFTRNSAGVFVPVIPTTLPGMVSYAANNTTAPIIPAYIAAGAMASGPVVSGQHLF